MQGTRRTCPDWKVGQRVQAYRPEGDHGAGFYPCKIVRRNADGTVDVQWDDVRYGPNNIRVAYLKQRPDHTGVEVQRLTSELQAQRQLVSAALNEFLQRINEYNPIVRNMRHEIAHSREIAELKGMVAQLKDAELVRSRISRGDVKSRSQSGTMP
jgi:hypothetical protein